MNPEPAGESWRNLHAVNDLVREIAGSHLVISALAGDGGVQAPDSNDVDQQIQQLLDFVRENTR